jgi:phospholipase C
MERTIEARKTCRFWWRAMWGRLVSRGWLVAIVGAAVVLSFVFSNTHNRALGDEAHPIKHVVVIMQENHSFDNVLGKLCVDDHRCDGTLTGKDYGGVTIPLHRSANLVPNIAHGPSGQTAALDKGKMDGFNKIVGCTHDQCYSYYDETQIPNLAALARTYALSDRTFSEADAASWAGHMAMVSPGNGWRNGWGDTYQFDGFTGDIPHHKIGAPKPRPGWGCDSNLNAPWKASPTAKPVGMPSCIPDSNGNGAYGATKVPHMPTLFDSLDNAGLSWKIYGALDPKDNGYKWNICPTFAECLAHQSKNELGRKTFAQDALAGQLPAVSYVIPNDSVSQHNNQLMSVGDNWIGTNVQAVMKGADWSSTAIFITYDDCGCFYDHVSPNTPTTGWGIRVPMVIVSPYARPGSTDSTPTSSTDGTMAFIEHTFGLPAIGEEANVYDYALAFDYSQTPPALPTMVQQRVIGPLPPSNGSDPT